MMNWKKIIGGIDQRFGGSAITNFVAIFALFVFIFALHQIAGGAQTNGIKVSETPIETNPVLVDDTTSPGIDLAAILMPNQPETETLKKVIKDPTPKKTYTTCVQKKKVRRSRAVLIKKDRKKRRRSPSIRDREGQVSVEELDRESVRLHYIALNGGKTPPVELRKLPTVEDLDGEIARLHYLSENKRIANNNPTRK